MVVHGNSCVGRCMEEVCRWGRARIHCSQVKVKLAGISM
ncbi:hypothetical protein GWL_27560 [Herbaspirillum sp. GW103]|nr:hypothetical protein GWL_27560 [Herbaspirillum sp. GW103]